MTNKKRKTSSYYILKNSEKLELKTQKYKIIKDTLVAASGVLIIAISFLSSKTMLTDSMTLTDFFSVMFGSGASFLGAISAGKDALDYSDIKQDIHEQAEKEGRVRR